LFGSIRSAQTTQVAYSGSHALLITARSTYSAVGVETGLAGLRPGDKVTFHIYSDGSGQLTLAIDALTWPGS
jgi:hypothetical protein